MMTMTKPDCLPRTSDPRFSNDATISNIHRPTSQSFTSNPNRLAFSTRRRPKRGAHGHRGAAAAATKGPQGCAGAREKPSQLESNGVQQSNGRYEESKSLVMIHIDKREKKVQIQMHRDLCVVKISYQCETIHALGL